MTGPDKTPRALEEMGQTGDARLFSPSAARNRDVVRDVLKDLLPTAPCRLLEVGSGTGEHAVHVASALSHITWQPSDPSGEAFHSIAAWREVAGLANLNAPLRLDVMEAGWWRVLEAPFDAVLSLNMIHIAPWEAALGLIEGAGALLSEGGALILYGPFSKGGVHNAPSNEDFDLSLKSRDPRWGVRDMDDLTREAATYGLAFVSATPMPANNQTLLFRKGQGGEVRS